VAAEIVSLPLYPSMSDEDVCTVIAAAERCLEYSTGGYTQTLYAAEQ
jgi:dTDP-4-amino-4,6-dideoxygalactose transaminase